MCKGGVYASRAIVCRCGVEVFFGAFKGPQPKAEVFVTAYTVDDENPADRPVTIMDLLRHTSGITYDYIGGKLIMKARAHWFEDEAPDSGEDAVADTSQ